MEGKKIPIIIDIGSGEIKAGFSGEEKPKLIFKNYIGEVKYKKVLKTYINQDKKKNHRYIGDDCESIMGLVKLRYPVKNGVFTDENDILPIFNYIFSKLGIKLDEIREHPILITEPLLNSYSKKKNIAKILFGSLDIECLYFSSQPILSLLSTSKTTGIILESGEGVSQSCVVCEGYSLPPSYERYDYGGGDVTNYLKNILIKKGCCFDSTTDYRLVQEIKENYCFFLPPNLNLEEENVKRTLNNKPIQYYLPDGTNIFIREESFLAPKILFDCSIIGKEYLGLADMIINSANKVDIQIKKKIFENIMLSGGNICLKGLEKKLEHELKNKNRNKNIFVNTIKEPKYSCWLGGSILSTLETFKNMWIKKSEWNEDKITLLDSRCI